MFSRCRRSEKAGDHSATGRGSQHDPSGAVATWAGRGNCDGDQCLRMATIIDEWAWCGLTLYRLGPEERMLMAGLNVAKPEPW